MVSGSAKVIHWMSQSEVCYKRQRPELGRENRSSNQRNHAHLSFKTACVVMWLHPMCNMQTSWRKGQTQSWCTARAACTKYNCWVCSLDTFLTCQQKKNLNDWMSHRWRRDGLHHYKLRFVPSTPTLTFDPLSHVDLSPSTGARPGFSASWTSSNSELQGKSKLIRHVHIWLKWAFNVCIHEINNTGSKLWKAWCWFKWVMDVRLKVIRV